MMKSKTVSLLLLLASLLAVGSLAAQGILHWAQQAQEQSFALAKDSKWITAHKFGIQAKVSNPIGNPQRDRVVTIRDLGPDIADLVEDLAPTAATLQINDRPPLALQFNSSGELEATVPAAWVNLLQRNRADLEVFHQGHLLVKFQLEGMFF
jgi:hypothetical protein